MFEPVPASLAAAASQKFVLGSFFRHGLPLELVRARDSLA